ncbi:MAG: cellobiose phosphorylase [Candidatus Omnitrophica bacterium]|nr:cellobiose phosphorylase [Candidatus Omnitrophota bacterium]
MSSEKKFYSFLSDGVSFRSTDAAWSRLIYAPLCGPDGNSIKSAITPLLSGDIKLDKGKYITRPASREDLRQPVRNFFMSVEGRGVAGIGDAADASVSVEIGQLWHKQVRSFPALGLATETLTFVPVSAETLELTRVTVKNISDQVVAFTPTAAIPIFGRALANKHDHEHVTALLHRIDVCADGVCVTPTMLFNEEGHKQGKNTYYVFGADGEGAAPQGAFPTIEACCGESGTLDRPEAVMQNLPLRKLSEPELQGREAMGALRFARVSLKPGAVKEFIIAAGIGASCDDGVAAFTRFKTSAAFDKALEANKTFWAGKTSSILFEDGDPDFDAWMRWVTLQPVLRRIFGCSFLPDHDYGKGGKGWRDIWQDLLSLILIEPESVRDQLLNNFAGIRIDGSNATIIGQKPGEFMADRNAITRVWMDHGAWPFLTTLLYINQSGDTDLLFEKAPYFADLQASRTFEKNTAWTPAYGSQLKGRKDGVYYGTVLEHILVQNLVPFFNVGEHNITRLESADWNDGLDMAFKRGESVAFMSFYAGNLLSIAELLEITAQARNLKTITVAAELKLLFDTLSSPVNYDNIAEKKFRLFDEYFKAVQPELSGDTCELDIAAVVSDLRAKGAWMSAHIRKQEKVSVPADAGAFTWFNGYYDNQGERVEGFKAGRVWMTLTGQVFPVMHGIANAEDTHEIIKSVRKFLKDKDLGGFRLNTDFGVKTHLALGRAFGFAFGTKENGAVFSHMAVMYGYALYKQGFAREGFEVLRSLYDMSMAPGKAFIYPGVPEYFDGTGRGMYHFLTGSASWYVLTLLTQAYGVRGEGGDLILSPKLVAEEFSASGEAAVTCQFAGKAVRVVYVNPKKKDAGAYRIEAVQLNGCDADVVPHAPAEVRLSRALLAAALAPAEIKVFLTNM